jgi:hypothetical protein
MSYEPSGKIAAFSLWTGMFWDRISFIPDETVNRAVTQLSLPHLWEQGITRDREEGCRVGEAIDH